MKTVAKIVFIIAVLVTIGGIGKINDDLSKRTAPCDTMFSADLKSGERCVRAALNAHNEAVNYGWGATIISAIVGLVAGAAILPTDDKNNAAK